MSSLVSNKDCWLCVYCDTEEVIEMMKFVEEKSPIMHVDVICDQVSKAIMEAHSGGDCNVTDTDVREHIARHVVTPVASVTRITRNLLDMCETLRPSAADLSHISFPRAPKRMRRLENTMTDDAVPGNDRADDEISVASTSFDDSTANPDKARLYLRTVGQVMNIYRMHGKLLMPS